LEADHNPGDIEGRHPQQGLVSKRSLLASGGVLLNGRELLFGEARLGSHKLSYFSTTAATKKGLVRPGNPKSAETLRIWSYQTF